MICTSLGNISYTEALKYARENEMIEIRADLLKYSDKEYKALFNQKAEVVVTCRVEDGEREKQRELFELAVKEKVRYIDLELEAPESEKKWLLDLCSNSSTDVIISYHNYKETPSEDELVMILKTLYKSGADIAKIATMVNKDQDMVNLLSLYRKQGRKVILGMGKAGVLTRVAAVILGAEFTFAAPDNDLTTAPGQLSLGEMKEILGILKI